MIKKKILIQERKKKEEHNLIKKCTILITGIEKYLQKHNEN